jgi:serine/threonine protein kinase
METSTTTGFCDECGLELATQAIKPLTAAQLMASGTLSSLTGPTPERTNCPACGHALKPNARHCPNCGKKLNDMPAAKAEAHDGPPSALREGLVVADRYGLESVLGEGGMGRVWKAFDKHLNKHVVIKTVLTPDERLRVALQKEAEVLINIRHPNIVAVIDFFTVETELCYVMEFVSGPSWADEIEEPVNRKLVLPMSAEEALTRVKGLLPAFKYLHGLNPPIVYCDFKPANVKSMKLPNGERVEVLLDFGAAYLYDPKVPPKPARGTPGYHSPNAAHPDPRDDYFTIGRTLAELVGMSEVHQDKFKYTLTPTDGFPWAQYDDSFRYFVEWLTATDRDDRPQSVDDIMAELEGVLGYVKGQKSDIKIARQRAKADFTRVSRAVSSTTGVVTTDTVRIDLPDVARTNPAATILLAAQDAYQQRNLTRALQLTNQAINNGGGSAAYVLRALVHNESGNTMAAEADLRQVQGSDDPHINWEMTLAKGQLHERTGSLEEAAACYRRMMALKPGDHRGRLLLADLYRRTGNPSQAINEYRAIIQARPNVGAAYLGASKAWLVADDVEKAIAILEQVSSRNTSYNEVLMELIKLYTRIAMQGTSKPMLSAARAIVTLNDNGVETRGYYRLVAEFYYTALHLPVLLTDKAMEWPFNKKPHDMRELARMNETAWREYLKRDVNADRKTIIEDYILAVRQWEMM